MPMEQIILADRKIPFLVIRKTIKHIYLRVKPEGYLQITANRHVGYLVIEALIHKNQKRILAEFINIDQRTSVNHDEAWILGEIYPCYRNVNFIHEVALVDGKLMLPSYSSEKDEVKATEKYYQKLVIVTAQAILDNQKERLGRLTNYQSIILKSQRMKSRFGCCQPQKRIIKINSLLGRFNPLYLEAILIHELVHLQVANHGKAFYAVLLSYFPNYRKIRQDLNRMAKTIGV
jgi:hypothetical protein